MFSLRNNFILFVCFAVFALSSPAHAVTHETFTLANGMQVVVIPNNKVPAVSHMVWYKVGAKDEPVGKSGIAHFLEHLMFKGTKKYGQGQFSRLIAKAGGNDNAFTSSDYTAYFQNISKDRLSLVMELESDRMENLIFNNDEVLKERDVVLEERSSRVDNRPLSQLREQMKAALYLNHPYAIPLIGWRHEIKGLSMADAKEWYRRYYAPNNAVLIVSGDITKAELQPLAEKYYGRIKARKVHKNPELKEPPQISPRMVTLSDNKVKKAEWRRYYMAPSQNSGKVEHCYALTLLSYILGEGSTSRLYQRLVVDDEVAVSVSGYYEDLTIGPSVFVLGGIPTDRSSVEDVGIAISGEIQLVKQNGVTNKELERAKNALIAQTIYAREDLRTLAYLYGQAVTTGAGAGYADAWARHIKAVTLDDIKLAANEVLDINHSVTGKLLKGGR